MSSWKNAAKSNQKTHRERRQPSARLHLGLLEKKKDYKRRAEDHHEKEATLKVLSRRALNKNPDEFYHHMINAKTKKGVHHEIEKEDQHTPDQLRLLQTQDLKYISMKRTIEANKIRRLQSSLHLIDAAASVPNQHTFFLEDASEAREFDLVKRLGTHPELINNKANRLRVEDLEKMKLPEIDEKVALSMKQKRDKSYRELAKRIEREQQLTVVQRKMEIKRHLQDKTLKKPKRVKAGTTNSAPVYKWKFQRKK